MQTSSISRSFLTIAADDTFKLARHLKKRRRHQGHHVHNRKYWQRRLDKFVAVHRWMARRRRSF